MNRFTSDDELESAWKSASEPISKQSLDRLRDSTLAELRSLNTRQDEAAEFSMARPHKSAEFSKTRRNESAGYYWVLAAMLLIGVHLGVAASWSSSFAYSNRLRDAEPGRDLLLARRQMIQSIESELKSITPTASHSSTD